MSFIESETDEGQEVVSESQIKAACIYIPPRTRTCSIVFCGLKIVKRNGVSVVHKFPF